MHNIWYVKRRGEHDFVCQWVLISKVIQGKTFFSISSSFTKRLFIAFISLSLDEIFLLNYSIYSNMAGSGGRVVRSKSDACRCARSD